MASVAADTKADLSLDSDDRIDFAEPGCNFYRPAWYGNRFQAVTGSQVHVLFKTVRYLADQKI